VNIQQTKHDQWPKLPPLVLHKKKFEFLKTWKTTNIIACYFCGSITNQPNIPLMVWTTNYIDIFLEPNIIFHLPNHLNCVNHSYKSNIFQQKDS